MIYTPKQRQVMRLWQRNELKRINLLEGSVSSGKTWISLVLWAFWVSQMPNDADCLYNMTGKSLGTLKNNCLLPLQSLVGESNFTFSTSAKEGRLFGRHILLEGANDAQAETKIRGLTLQGGYIDEATKVPKDYFVMMLSRLRKPNAKLFATTNPDSPSHWLKTEYIDRAEELKMLDICFNLFDNKENLTQEYIDSIQLEYTGVFYDRFILGQWALSEGLVYSNFETAFADEPEGTPSEYALSLDYGTYNAFACLLWARYGDVWYAVDEYYYSGRENQRQLTDEEYGIELDERFGRFGEYKRLDTIIDPSAASFIALLKRKYRYKPIPADNDVLDGIRETGTAIQKGLIKICPKCANLRRELASYTWDEKSVDDRPVKDEDHACDALRYFVKTKKVTKPRLQYKSMWM